MSIREARSLRGSRRSAKRSNLSFCLDRVRQLLWVCLAIAANSHAVESQEYTSSADHADAIVETVTSLSRSGSNPVCIPQAIEPSLLVVLSSYSGGAGFPQYSRNNNIGLAEVRVFPTEEPVFLVLSGYEEIVWRILMEPGARVSGVALIGYQLQHVLDLPPNVPLGSRASKRLGSRQQLECVHTIELDEKQSRDWEKDTWSTIDSIIQAQRLFGILKGYGLLRLHDHQWQTSSESRLVFEVME